MAQDSGTMSLTEFVDSWLDALTKAQADTEAKGLTNNSRLHASKYVKDLLDALSWQLRTYIEHPDPLRPTRKVTLSNDKLVVTDGDDMNLSGKTRRARLEILMQKIMRDKGSDGGKRYKKLEKLFKEMPFAPTKLADDVKWKSVNTSKLPHSSKARVTQYYYDPRNVDNDLATGTVWASDVNMQDIDQFRNSDGRFNKTMKNLFGVPDYRTMNDSLVNKASSQLGPYSFLGNSTQVPATRQQMKDWVKNQNQAIAGRSSNNKPKNNNQNARAKNGGVQQEIAVRENEIKTVNTALGQNGLQAPTAANTLKIAEDPTPAIIAANSVQNSGQKPTIEQVVGAAGAIQTATDVKETLVQNGLVARDGASVPNIVENPTPAIVEANTVQLSGEMPTKTQAKNTALQVNRVLQTP